MTAENRVKTSLERALVSLDAAVETIHIDVEAATDDLLAARLLVATALTTLGPEPDGDEVAGTCTSPPPQTSIASSPRGRTESSPTQCT
jgi:hypothetical protein